MMRYLIPAVCFFGGAFFGMLTMGLVVANRNFDEVEVMEFAGGSREQDGEPGNLDDEAVLEGDPDSGTEVPEAPGE